MALAIADAAATAIHATSATSATTAIVTARAIATATSPSHAILIVAAEMTALTAADAIAMLKSLNATSDDMTVTVKLVIESTAGVNRSRTADATFSAAVTTASM